MIEDATSFLNRFDYAAIDHAAAVRSYQDQEAQLIKQQVATEGEGEAQPRLRGDSLTSAALSAWTVARLKAHLTADGYAMATTPGSDLFLMSLTNAWLCK